MKYTMYKQVHQVEGSSMQPRTCLLSAFLSTAMCFAAMAADLPKDRDIQRNIFRLWDLQSHSGGKRTAPARLRPERLISRPGADGSHDGALLGHGGLHQRCRCDLRLLRYN